MQGTKMISPPSANELSYKFYSYSKQKLKKLKKFTVHLFPKKGPFFIPQKIPMI